MRGVLLLLAVIAVQLWLVNRRLAGIGQNAAQVRRTLANADRGGALPIVTDRAEPIRASRDD